jgi:K+-sensing histidine kinase KdpD
MSPKPTAAEIGAALALLVHDLRNPAATLGANTGFLAEVDLHNAGADPDVAESIGDMSIAMTELMDGFRHFGWLARWLGGNDIGGFIDASAEIALGTLRREIEASAGGGGAIQLDVESPNLIATCGACLPALARIFYQNAQRHARATPIRWRLLAEGDEIIFEHRDQGAAIAPELRELAFTLEGQAQLKGRRDGRYGRCLSLFSAGLIAERSGARVEADEDGEYCVFRVRLIRCA